MNLLTEFNLLTECKKQFKPYIGFRESKINGNWAAIIRKFPSKTYLSERDKWDNETITKFEKDCAKGNYHAVGKLTEFRQQLEMPRILVQLGHIQRT